MTAKPSTMQLRRWFILFTSHSQMIHSSNFEMSHGKRRLSDLIAHSDSSTAERAATLIFLLHGASWGRRGSTHGCGAGYAGMAAFGGALSGVGTGGAAASAAAHHGGAAAAAAAAPGVDPHPFGHGRASDADTTRIEAATLYDVFDPTDFDDEWAVDEVGRVAGALVGLSLPFDSCNLALTLTALDRAVFNSPVALTPTLDLVAADVTQGNGGFAMFGGVNDSLE